MESDTKSAESQAITVTTAAEKFMRRMVRFGGQGAGAGFRLIVRPGGCSGLASEFSIEATPRADDRVLSFNGLQLFLSPDSHALLAGVTIDFVDTRHESGLAFIDPKAGACSCATGAVGVQLGTLPS
ncbi:MAG TPA: iron-sulfur cluster assembly accessory protein [Polyangiaceae bacterium]